MDFFARQQRALNASHLLLVGFLLALVAIALFLHTVVGTLSYLLGESSHPLSPSPQANALIGILWLAILAGAGFRWLDVRAGRTALARRFGANALLPATRDESERRLLAVTAEMAIASSSRPPALYVLPHERSINAFVVGNSNDALAIVVTRGALDLLDRDQLQALVAHEFGHITRGDLQINMRLLIALGGLLALDEIGRLLIGRNPREFAHPGVLVGYLLRVLGSAGLSTGLLLRAAFSRQREYLADASAVQYTRNSHAVAALLARIRDQGGGEPLVSQHAEALSHLCFHDGRHSHWYRRLFASHPTLTRRIAAIDPHFSIRQRLRKRRTQREPKPRNDATRKPAGTAGAAVISGTGTASNVIALPMVAAQSPGLALPDDFVLMFARKTDWQAALVALFAGKDPLRWQCIRRELADARGSAFGRRLEQFATALAALDSVDEINLIDFIARGVCERFDAEERRRMLLEIEQTLGEIGERSLLDHARLRLIRRRLGADFPCLAQRADGRAVQGARRPIRSFEAMGEELALLLSLMVEASGTATAELDRQFERVLRCYTQTRWPRRNGQDQGVVEELDRAFRVLSAQPVATRQALVQHCAEIMRHDGIIAQRERTFVQVVAEALDCDVQAA